MTQLQTDKKLLEKLTNAARRNDSMTADEIRAQRLSFLVGFLSEDSNMTKPQIAKIIADHEKGRAPN